MPQKKNKLTVNFLYQSAYQLLTILLPLITAPYISRVLGAENTGIFSYSNVVAHYFMIFAALGIENYGNRTIARAKTEGQDKINHAFSSLFYMHAFVSALVVLGYAVYILFFVSEYKMIAAIQSFLIIGAFFDVNWFFFGIEEFKLTVTRNMIVKICTVCAMFLFVRTEADLWKYTLIMALGTFISQTVVWIFIPKYVKFVKVEIKDILAHFKPLCIIFLAVIATSLYRLIDKLMLGWAGDMNALGSYEYADRLIKMVVTLITALGTVMLPRMSALYKQNKNELAKKYLNTVSQITFVMSFALAFGLAGISNEFMVVFLGKGYDSASLLACILAISIPFIGWNNYVRTMILMPKSKDKIYTRAVWAGAVVDVILNAILIFTIGSVGAAISTVIAYFVVSLFQTIPIRKEFNVLEYLKHILFPLLSGIIMFVTVRFIGNQLGTSILTVIIEIVCGAAIYLTLNAIYLKKNKNELFMKYWNKIFARGSKTQ